MKTIFTIYILCLVLISCNQESSNSSKQLSVIDWYPSCDFSRQCTKNEIMRDLKGTTEFKSKIKENIGQYKKGLGDSYFYICGVLMEVGGCGLDLKSLSKSDLNGFLRGLANCHHYQCTDYFKKNKTQLSALMSKNNREAQLLILNLELIQPVPWSRKDRYLKEYLKLVSAKKPIRYEEVSPLVSSIPNHQLVKKFIADNFLNIHDRLNDISVYLARYRTSWHDVAYQSVKKSGSKKHVEAFIYSMPISCPRLRTILVFKDDLDGFSKELRYILNDEQLKKHFPKVEGSSIKESKCFSFRS